MFWNYLKSAYRNFTRNKFYTLINILGLSIGLAAFIFILFYLKDEIGYDKHHVKYRQIHRIDSEYSINNKVDKFAIAPVPMGPAFKLEFPEIEEFVRLYGAGNSLIKHGNKEYYEEDFYFCDSTIFDVFTHEFVAGGPEKALTEPNTIVLTEKIARKYFGDEDPLGEIITTGAGNNYSITAVIKDLPINSHLRFDALLSGATIAERQGVENFNSLEPVRFWNIGVYTYILLNENSDIQVIYDKFPDFYDKYMRPIGDQINASYSLITTPLADTHYRAGLAANQPTGNRAYIFIFSSIAIFILIIAAINYMNMATARSTNRAREVGMRKVSGAFRSQLIWQFIGESLLLTVIAMGLAMLMVYLLFPSFNTLAGKSIEFNSTPLIFVIIVIVSVFIGLISGSYPAFYLSSFRPVVVLKGQATSGGRNSGLFRKILVVIQFFIAIVIIITTLAVSDQLRFLKKKDLGFEKENLVVMQLQDSTFRSKVESFKSELLQNPSITGVSNATGVPGNITWIQVINVEKDSMMVESSLILAQVDYDYIDVMGMEIVQGRNFDKNMSTDDTGAVIINQTAMASLGWEDNPIGKKIDYGIDLDGNVARPMKVVGVVKDFHFRSLHNPVEPMMLFITPVPRYLVSARIKGENVRQTLDFIEEKWNDFGAKRPFDYEFLEESMDEMYQAEVKISRIMGISTLLTIVIALLGLLGLSSYIAERKTKQIGIRKILGASTSSILRLMFREFTLLILIAFVLAIPVAYWRIDIWLKDNFIYYTDIHWYTFLFAGLIAFIIGILTISYHIIKAASENPVNAIKYE
jgi:putative ABC transport system permease protein